MCRVLYRIYGSTAGRTEGNQAAAYRQGKWETAYLSTDGAFARELPELADQSSQKLAVELHVRSHTA